MILTMNEWTSSGLDGLSDDKAIERLTTEFPRWQYYRGTDGMCHARTHDPVYKPVRGEDWTDLRDELIREAWRSQ